jgi:plasmid stability protein
MVNLTLKNIPDGLHGRLKAQAERNRRSLNAEAIVCLERGLGTASVDAGEMRERLLMVRERAGGYLTDDIVESGRREGRE